MKIISKFFICVLILCIPGLLFAGANKSYFPLPILNSVTGTTPFPRTAYVIYYYDENENPTLLFPSGTTALLGVTPFTIPPAICGPNEVWVDDGTGNLTCAAQSSGGGGPDDVSGGVSGFFVAYSESTGTTVSAVSQFYISGSTLYGRLPGSASTPFTIGPILTDGGVSAYGIFNIVGGGIENIGILSGATLGKTNAGCTVYSGGLYFSDGSIQIVAGVTPSSVTNWITNYTALAAFSGTTNFPAWFGGVSTYLMNALALSGFSGTTNFPAWFTGVSALVTAHTAAASVSGTSIIDETITTDDVASTVKAGALAVFLDGAGSVLAAGASVWVVAPYNMGVTGYNVVCDGSGNTIALSILTAYMTDVPARLGGTSIFESGGSRVISGTTFEDWTSGTGHSGSTSIKRGDVIVYEIIDATATAQKVFITLEGNKEE